MNDFIASSSRLMAFSIESKISWSDTLIGTDSGTAAFAISFAMSAESFSFFLKSSPSSFLAALTNSTTVGAMNSFWLLFLSLPYALMEAGTKSKSFVENFQSFE